MPTWRWMGSGSQCHTTYVTCRMSNILSCVMYHVSCIMYIMYICDMIGWDGRMIRARPAVGMSIDFMRAILRQQQRQQQKEDKRQQQQEHQQEQKQQDKRGKK